ncbi:hypothetical protein U1Q18_032314 [Sarracenia purpurea var. burkii]
MQIDLHGDISGLLSAHPQSPLLSLHHPEEVDPWFPTMNRRQSVNHLMKAARTDQSRLLQQTICYHRDTNWSFSVSWGYSVHIYENIYPKSILQKPIETFRPWVLTAVSPLFVFNTRVRTGDPCKTPHVFFFKSVKSAADGNQVLTTYGRAGPRRLPACLLSGNHSANRISRIRVFSSATKLTAAHKRECCDVVLSDEKNIAEIRYRDCVKDEVIA